MTDTFRRDLAVGIAEFLAASGAAQWDWEGTIPYALDVDEWPVYLGPDMPARPDRCVVVTVGTMVRRDRGNVEVPVQIRLRGAADDPDAPGVAALAVQRLAERVGDLFQPKGRPLVQTMLGVVPVGIVLPGSSADLGRDEKRRSGATVNVTVRTKRIIGTTAKPRVILNRVFLTSAQYDRLESIDPNTVYSLTDLITE